MQKQKINISDIQLLAVIHSVKNLSNTEKAEWKKLIPALNQEDREKVYKYFDGISAKEMDFEMQLIAKNNLKTTLEKNSQKLFNDFKKSATQKEKDFKNK